MEETRLLYGKFRAFTIVFNGFFMYLLDITMFAFVAFLLLKSSITIGSATAALAYIKEFTFPIRSLVSAISDLKFTQSIKKRIFSYFDNKEVEAMQAHQFSDKIQFEHVSYTYPESNFSVNDLNLEIQKGKKYAIIGHSGSGKSTIVKLLSKQLSPYSGRIMIDEHELSSIEHSSFLWCVNQFEHIFASDFLDNVTIFKSYPSASLDKIKSLLHCSQIEDIYNRADCSNLSGGEKDILIAIRSLLINNDVIVLDEPMISLDTKSKSIIREALYGWKEKTLIAVTHDITESTLNYFDYIIWMSDGKISTFGSAADIVKMPEFAKLKKSE